MGVNGEEPTTVTNMDSTTCTKVPTIITKDGVSKLVDNPNLEIVTGEVTINLSNNGNTHEMVINIDGKGKHKENPLLSQQPTMRIYSKADPNYSLAIRDGNVILAVSNPLDPFQHWIKYENDVVKDEQGYPSFVLVNKATGLAIKHPTGGRYPVQLTDYNPIKMDESVLWTQSKDLSDSYGTIRMVNNTQLVFDAFNGIKKHGGVRDGTEIVLWEWVRGENQLWKVDPYTINTNNRNEKTIINIQTIMTTDDGASATPVDDPVVKFTIGGVTFHLSNNGNNPKMVIGIVDASSNGKGIKDNESDDAIITKMDERMKLLQEQNKSFQEQVIKLLQEQVQGKDGKEDAMEKQIKTLKEHNKALPKGEPDKLYFSHTSGPSIVLIDLARKYDIVCPSCNYNSGMAWKRSDDDGKAVDAIIGRGLHVDKDGNELITPSFILSETYPDFNYQAVGKTVSERGPPYFGLNVHCPWCAYELGRHVNGNYEDPVKAGKHNHT